MLVVYAFITLIYVLELKEFGTENVPPAFIIYPLSNILILSLS
jgi:hypothetical protein